MRWQPEGKKTRKTKEKTNMNAFVAGGLGGCQ